MKKTRKYKIVWTVVLITALLFSGCGKMKESASSVSAESDDEEYSVEILTPTPENGTGGQENENGGVPGTDTGTAESGVPGTDTGAAESDTPGTNSGIPGTNSGTPAEGTPGTDGSTSAPGNGENSAAGGNDSTAGGGKDGSTASGAPGILPGEAAQEGEIPGEGQAPQAAEEEASSLGVVIGGGFRWSQDEETYKTLYEITYPYVGLSDRDEEKYPALAKAMRAKSDAFRQQADETEEWMQESLADFAEAGVEDFGYLYYKENLHVIRADQEAVSVLGTYESYSGGVHGMYGYTCCNFDTRTGKELSLSDVVADVSSFLPFLRAEIEKQYPDLSMMSAEYTLTEEYADDLVFSIGYENITFYFEPYLLGAYAEGAQVVGIPLAGNESIFNPRFYRVPENYAVEVPGEIRIDLAGNGNPVSVRVEYEKDYETDMLNSVTIYAGNASYKETESCADGFEVTPTLVKLGKKTFLYLEFSYMNDYAGMTVYDLTGGSVKKVGDTPYSVAKGWTEDYEMSYRAAMTDPMLTELWVHTDVLGTGRAYSFFYVGEDGMPVNYNEGYFLEHYGQDDLTLLQNLTAIAIEPNKKAAQGTEVTIPRGTKVKPYFTDNETYVEIADPDGNCYWIRGNFTEYPMTIGGVEIQEIFDGMMFAG